MNVTCSGCLAWLLHERKKINLVQSFIIVTINDIPSPALCYCNKTLERTNFKWKCFAVAVVLEATVQGWVDLLLWACGVSEGNLGKAAEQGNTAALWSRRQEGRDWPLSVLQWQSPTDINTPTRLSCDD